MLDSLDTKNMYSDIGSILAPVVLPVAVDMQQRSPSVSLEGSVISGTTLSRMFGLDGRSIAGFSYHFAPGIYVRQKGTVNEVKKLLSR